MKLLNDSSPTTKGLTVYDALAKKAGKYNGQKPALSPQQVAEIKQRVLTGESKAALAREFGVTRPTVYRALKNV
ncbi:helix-turn-helix domain-containing protein [Corynebacterium confusum]|uniref:helix-turn-helix domain-containing protein n=1 Tax=Corynebacterium confusum TaxID=71254 RepID=UPI0033905E42